MLLGASEIPITDLGQYGIAGLISMIFLWFAWQVYKRERDRADANEKEIARLNQVMLEATQGSQKEAIRVLESVKDLLQRRRS